MNELVTKRMEHQDTLSQRPWTGWTRAQFTRLAATVAEDLDTLARQEELGLFTSLSKTANVVYEQCDLLRLIATADSWEELVQKLNAGVTRFEQEANDAKGQYQWHNAEVAERCQAIYEQYARAIPEAINEAYNYVHDTEEE